VINIYPIRLIENGGLVKVDKVRPDLYRIETPLPRNPLKYVNSYVIKSSKPLIIDTSFNLDVCYLEFIRALREIGVDFRRADYFITHLHADHLGLAGRLTKEVFMSSIDSEIASKIIDDISMWKKVIEYFVMNGLPQEDAEKIISLHPAIRYLSKVDFHNVDDRETLEYGDYSLQAVLTPGHTPGHMCLYDEDKKIIFSGDHILFDITPNITYWEGREALEEYLKSLDKIYQLDIEVTLPGHRSFKGDIRRRIFEIKEHHTKRLREVINSLKNGMKTAWQIAASITWELKYDKWDDIPVIQKWFIIGETIAHLQYLEKKKIIAREIIDGLVYYSLT
jgi:glyoxylase-like metal-dependent hydrolase (beta-lactamase superfamily II)